jgi:predicted nucleotidyltransferase
MAKKKRVKKSVKKVKKAVKHKKKPKVEVKPVKKVEKPKKPAKKVKKPARKRITDIKEIATIFATKAHEKFDRMIKASILFGSQVKETSKPESDIDIIFIIDDVSINWDLELISWYREELGKIISTYAKEYKRDFHINTVKLSTWWRDLTHGDPVVVNILRYGEALIDSGGFFHPLKALLIEGKIRATPEAAYTALQRAPSHLARSKASELGAIEGVYWTFVDASQAALITAGKLPPSPEHIPDLLKEAFVDAGVLKKEYITAFRTLHALHKGIAHGEIADIKGVEIDKWQHIAERFLSEMTRVIDKLLEVRKEEPAQSKEVGKGLR